MITNFKIFDNKINQQPFFLRNDYLYISDDFAKKLTPDEYDLRNRDRFPVTDDNLLKKLLGEQESFFNDEKKDMSWGPVYKEKRLITWKHVSWSPDNYMKYRMDIIIYRGNKFSNNAGTFYYYIGGQSGDSEMHGKNMIRGTRSANLNLMIKYYPIVAHIANFYKRLKNGELFFDIITDELEKNLTLAKYGVPEELKNIFGDAEDMIKNSDKYNL